MEAVQEDDTLYEVPIRSASFLTRLKKRLSALKNAGGSSKESAKEPSYATRSQGYNYAMQQQMPGVSLAPGSGLPGFGAGAGAASGPRSGRGPHNKRPPRPSKSSPLVGSTPDEPTISPVLINVNRWPPADPATPPAFLPSVVDSPRAGTPPLPLPLATTASLPAACFRNLTPIRPPTSHSISAGQPYNNAWGLSDVSSAPQMALSPLTPVTPTGPLTPTASSSMPRLAAQLMMSIPSHPAFSPPLGAARPAAAAAADPPPVPVPLPAALSSAATRSAPTAQAQAQAQMLASPFHTPQRGQQQHAVLGAEMAEAPPGGHLSGAHGGEGEPRLRLQHAATAGLDERPSPANAPTAAAAGAAARGGGSRLSPGASLCGSAAGSALTSMASSAAGGALNNTPSSAAGGSLLAGASTGSLSSRLRSSGGGGGGGGGGAGASASGDSLLAVSSSLPTAMRRGPVWRLADYSVGSMLYQGAISQVYKATCRVSSSPVVLKVYDLGCVSPNLVHTLVREIDIHISIVHPHVALMYGVFQESGRLVLVLERAAAGDLYRLQRRLPGCRLSEQQATCLVLAPLLSALAACHSRGLVHRDIKPENLLLSGSWRLMLADWGAAIDLGRERAVTRTGTAEYMAPEVRRCPIKALPEDNKEDPSLAYSTAADIWSVGVLAFELLVGFPPAIAPPPAAAAGLAAAAAAAASRIAFPAFLTVGAQDFIATALAADPSDRPTAVQLMGHPWLKQAVRQMTAQRDERQRALAARPSRMQG